MKKERIDILLIERNLIDSRSLAQKIIMAGNVVVDGQMVDKPSTKVSIDSKIIVQSGPKFVSRGGEKLEPALIKFGFENLNGKICADLGASTGGFTDCLLQFGAKLVYAVDVGYGILHWKLRTDPRVIVMERTNARFIESFPDPIEFVTIDASFISLKTLLPVVFNWIVDDGNMIVLIKPQFEAGKEEAAKGSGVIRDPIIHKKIIFETLLFAKELGFDIKGLMESPIRGPKGNIEFLSLLQKVINPTTTVQEIENFIASIFKEDSQTAE